MVMNSINTLLLLLLFNLVTILLLLMWSLLLGRQRKLMLHLGLHISAIRNRLLLRAFLGKDRLHCTADIPGSLLTFTHAIPLYGVILLLLLLQHAAISTSPPD